MRNRTELQVKREAFEAANPDLWKFFIPVKSRSDAWEKNSELSSSLSALEKKAISEMKTSDVFSRFETSVIYSESKSVPKLEQDTISPRQIKWGTLCQNAVKNTITMLDDKHPDTDSLYIFFQDYLGQNVRSSIAKEMDHPVTYGMPRIHIDRSGNEMKRTFEMKNDVQMWELINPTSKQYSSQYDFLKTRLIDFSQQKENVQFSVLKHGGFHRGVSYEVIDVGIYGKGLDNNRMEKDLLYSSVALVKFANKPEGNIFTIHMGNDDITSALRYANQFYQELLVLKNQTDNEYAFTHKLGVLCWHLFNIMSLIRGSASAVEILMAAFLQSKFIVPIKPNDGISLDFRAFVTPNPNEYASYFCRLQDVKKPGLEMESKPLQKTESSFIHNYNQDNLIYRSYPEFNENSLKSKDSEQHMISFPLLANKMVHPSDRFPCSLRDPRSRYEINRLGYAKYIKNFEDQALKATLPSTLLLFDQTRSQEKIFRWIEMLSSEEEKIMFSSIVKKYTGTKFLLDEKDIARFQKIMSAYKLTHSNLTSAPLYSGEPPEGISKMLVSKIILAKIADLLENHESSLIEKIESKINLFGKPKPSAPVALLQSLRNALQFNKNQTTVNLHAFLTTRFNSEPSLQEIYDQRIKKSSHIPNLAEYIQSQLPPAAAVLHSPAPSP